jgi:thymidylate synthase ThyX
MCHLQFLNLIKTSNTLKNKKALMSQQDLIDREKPDDLRLSELGHQVMSQYVTSTTSNVYAVKDTLSDRIVSAAMARLSRSPDDMRVIIANEFSPEIKATETGSQGKEIGLLRRVITAYGDDSVQQLGNIAVVVEDASNILTKLLERPRIGAAYLERSTRYILFDTMKLGPDGKMHYRYTVPPELDAESAAEFSRTMDDIFELYSVIVRNLIRHIGEKSIEDPSKRDAAWRAAVRAQACDAARGILPLCTTSTVGI